MSRTTDDPKEYTIKVRLNEDMYNYIKDKSEEGGITLSEYLRSLINNTMAIRHNSLETNL